MVKLGQGFQIRSHVWSIETARRIIQVFSFAFFTSLLFGWGPWPFVLPVLFSLGVHQKAVGDALAMLQWMLHDAVFPWLPLASFFLIAVFLGRALCGWVCPFGFVQDLLGYIKRKHTVVAIRNHNWLIKIKYLVLAIILLVSGSLAFSLATGMGQGYKIALGEFAPAPFSVLSPADTLFAVLPRIVLDVRYAGLDALLSGVLAIQPLLYARIALMIMVLALGIFIPRSWCRYLCPHGAAMAFLNQFSFLGLKRDPLKCKRAECHACVETCPMKVPILDLPWEKFTSPECTYCLKCVEACTAKAIKPQFP